MPDRTKYPPGFNADYFPILTPTLPLEVFVRNETLLEDNHSYDCLLDLEDIRIDHPTATHLYIENESSSDGERNIKIEIRRSYNEPNPNYATQMQQYNIAKANFDKAKATWETLSQQWKAEVAAEHHDARYQMYLKLKEEFEATPSETLGASSKPLSQAWANRAHSSGLPQMPQVQKG